MDYNFQTIFKFFLKINPFKVIKPLEIASATAFVAGDQSVRVQWTIEPRTHPKLVNLNHFTVEYYKKTIENNEAEIKTDEWQIYANEILPYVRAHTIKSLTPGFRLVFK